MTPPEVRLQKFLSERGVTSRRGAVDLLASGRITVNGSIIREPGTRINPASDTVLLDGNPLSAQPPRKRTILLYKPAGYVCTAARNEGPTVYDLIPDIPERLIPVGRLDRESEGLLLMTNDGELALRLTHPRYGHSKTYEVTVVGDVTDEILTTLQSRIELDGYTIQPVDVRLKRRLPRRHVMLEFTLHEGRNRQIRNMCRYVKIHVESIVRVRLGPLTIGKLTPGQWRDVKPRELAQAL